MLAYRVGTKRLNSCAIPALLARPAAVVIVVATAVLATGGCNGDTTHVVCQGKLASTDSGRKLESFVETWNALIGAAGEIDRDMLNVCRSMATDLALPSAAASPTSPGSDAPGAETQATCGRVKQEIDRITRTNLLAGARLAVMATPVVCGVDLDARLRCEQDCDSTAATRLSRLPCAPGKACGQCMDTCTGTCTGTCATGCAGTCTGICTGTCAGRCNGRCDGTCSARNVDGSCYGTCAGTCAGMCDGGCTGSCDATCSGTCAASCIGTCLGTCATAWRAPPLCAAPEAETTVADCRINCDARSRFQAVCAEPVIGVSYGVSATPPQRIQLDRLVAALRANFARLAKVGYRAATLVDSAATGYAVALQGQLETARQVGPDAAACVTQAIPLVSDAVTKINLSVDLHTSLTASVAAMGGLPPLP